MRKLQTNKSALILINKLFHLNKQAKQKLNEILPEKNEMNSIQLGKDMLFLILRNNQPQKFHLQDPKNMYNDGQKDILDYHFQYQKN